MTNANRGDHIELCSIPLRPDTVPRTPRHPREIAQVVHRPEGHVEADKEQYEMPPARGCVQHPAGPLGKPSNIAKEGEDRAADRDIMQNAQRRRTCQSPEGPPTATQASPRSSRPI